MEERQASLKDFKQGEARILIATDLAARGIDIRELLYQTAQKPTFIESVVSVGQKGWVSQSVWLELSTNECGFVGNPRNHLVTTRVIMIKEAIAFGTANQTC